MKKKNEDILLSEEGKTYAVDCPDLAVDFAQKTKVRFELKHLIVPLLVLLVAGFLLWCVLNRFGGTGKLVINEVLTNNHGSFTDPSLGSPDFVEIYNGTDRAVNMKGYGVSDSIKNCYKYKLPDVVLGPGEYLLVYFTGGTPGADENPFCTGFGLDKTGDTVALVDDNYDLLDSVEVPELPADVSYGRNAEGKWVYFTSPTPGKENPASGLATLDTEVQVSACAGLLFTEICTANHDAFRNADGLSPDFAELRNCTASPVSLKGVGIGTASDRRFRYVFPEKVLAPGEYLIVTFDDAISDAFNAPFRLSRNGESLFLTDPDYILLDSVTVPALADDCSWARRTDLSWGYCKAPTPGAFNDGEISEVYVG